MQLELHSRLSDDMNDEMDHDTLWRCNTVHGDHKWILIDEIAVHN